MIIALDYDDTYTRDPEFWNKVIDLAQSRGHLVVCVTMRHQHEIEIEKFPPNITIITTDRKAKFFYVAEKGIIIDVWIDDSPFFLLNDG